MGTLPANTPGIACVEDLDGAYRTHAPAALRRARRLLGTDQDALEAVHDVFVRLLENPSQYRGEAPLSTYFYSAVTRACLNRIRDRRTRLRLLRERFAAGLFARRPGVSPEATSVLRGTLERMPPPLAEVAIYYYMDGLTQDEIATLLGCARRTVGHHLTQIARWATKQELAACRI